MTTLKKTMTAVLLASQCMLYANIGHAVNRTFSGPASINKIQKALSFIRTNKISLTGVCSGDLERAPFGCGVTPLNRLFWEQLIGAVPLTTAIGIDDPGSEDLGGESPYVSLDKKSLLLFRLSAGANADAFGPTIEYRGPVGTRIAIILFSERGFLYEPKVDVSGTYLPTGFLTLPPGSAVPYSSVSIFDPLATAAPQGKFYALVTAYMIDTDGLAKPVTLQPDVISFIGIGWSVG